jgi:hypothetical protein
MLGHLQIQTNYMLSLLLNYSKAKYKRLTYLQIQLIELLSRQLVVLLSLQWQKFALVCAFGNTFEIS